MTRLSLIALGVLWILMPVWMIAVIYLGQCVRRACERQAEALELIAQGLDGFLNDMGPSAHRGDGEARPE